MTEPACCTKAQIAKNLKTSGTCSDAGVQREISKRVATLSNTLSATKAASSEVASSAKLE